METTDMDQWKRIAATIDEFQAARSDLFIELAHESNIPKTEYMAAYQKLETATDTLKSDLENRLFEEHPDEASTDLFYGNHEADAYLPVEVVDAIEEILDDGQTVDEWVAETVSERLDLESE